MEIITTTIGLTAAKKITDLTLASVWASIASKLESDKSIKLSGDLEKALENYTKITFERCTKIKTLINRDTPIDLLPVYVPIRFKHGSKILSDYDVIENIEKNKRITISGTGGSGKSIFTRYLWICQAEHSKKIPIFLELRQLNEISSDDLIVFLYYKIFGDSIKSEGINQFKNMMSKGKFSFIFDGFDEIKEEKKKVFERHIFEMSNNYSDCLFTVSTRPLDNIHSWSNSKNYDVAPMEKKDILLLIERIDFNHKVKQKFIDAIKNQLYESHRSFLEIPLLVTVMLFVFNDIADIPNEMNVFYDQAFSALFRRHDASKEAFERKLNSNLSYDTFRTMVAGFCFFSYIAAKPQFNDQQLLSYIFDASKYLGISVNSEAFKQDLKDNICFLQVDGLDYVFIHRTFQEYFAAVFISNLPENDWVHAVKKLPNNRTENVIKLLFEMNKHRFDTALTLKISNILGDAINADDVLWQRIMDKEYTFTSINLHFPRSSFIKEDNYIYIWFNIENSFIFKFLYYYVAFCRKNLPYTYENIVGVKYGSLPTQIKSIINSKNSKKIRPPLDCQIFEIDKNLKWDYNKEFFEKDSDNIEAFKDIIITSNVYNNFIKIMKASIEAINLAKAEKIKRDKSNSILFGKNPFD